MTAPFACSDLLKTIARGGAGARALPRDDAQRLFAAILNGQVGDIELGAVLVAYRIKGETPDELAGMLAAAQACIAQLVCPGERLPVVLPSYNGARKQPNLTPLLALLLAREGVPVLVHGVSGNSSSRVTSAAIFAALGHAPALSVDSAQDALARGYPAFMPIEALSAPLAHLLEMRAVIGVRNSGHTLVKLLQPFRQPALRLVNFTHPEYRDTLTTLFTDPVFAGPAGVLLARGTEGEPVADARRQAAMDWLRGGRKSCLVAADAGPLEQVPALPASDANSTAAWIREVLSGKTPVPAPIARQVDAILQICRQHPSPAAGVPAA
ncbi:hypothetical protein PATSB16_34940 [Pandoraea thiooxydans]|uniref:Glycosyl transferase n=1 Tax=Pandoraea thiooxydans TaxID=445709 RepID=A0A0G3EV35_9BURK|nr:DNA-binding protein YbiB [Pandoraea thiooxydans]AKJ69227.1 DNA-binding protein YbiB [Pandoraea thiooxydans]APR96830.1 hypothetical protein PATSB16_34940 [Pandoraea thiooxydans]